VTLPLAVGASEACCTPALATASAGSKGQGGGCCG
jgi:hypothetical protein